MLLDGACVHRAGQTGLAHCSWATLLVRGSLLGLAWVGTGLWGPLVWLLLQDPHSTRPWRRLQLTHAQLVLHSVCVHRAGQMCLAHCGRAFLVLGSLLGLAWVGMGMAACASETATAHGSDYNPEELHTCCLTMSVRTGLARWAWHTAAGRSWCWAAC